ncbi:MAG TPA: threonine--tRNA ligase [Fibrobacteria bacterium]|nr:threonine--tRNA ligase [Fibrobacteria bacterium]
MLEKYDHRRLGRRLELFHQQEEAPGMAFWHPNGRLLYRLLEDAARKQVEAAGYREVCTPQILRKSIWEQSGHWDHYRENMFLVSDQACEAAVKPVSCPGHIQILKSKIVSHRDLPIRLAEFGLVHRDEQKGALHGLLRLRQFTQDDGHIFCRPDQAREEVERFCRSLPPFYRAFGFEDLSVAFSTRPDHRAGDDAAWDESEAALASVLERLGVPFTVQQGSGAFYGPKLEFILKDRQGRDWQCGTIQFDLVMPESFGANYIDAAGEGKPLVILHRALYGSLERFLGILLEHHGPFLPPWLAPVQARVLPVAERHAKWAEGLARRLRGEGLRCDVSAADESLARRIALARQDAVSFVLAAGDREARGGEVALRTRDGQESLSLEAAVEVLKRRCASPFTEGAK